MDSEQIARCLINASVTCTACRQAKAPFGRQNAEKVTVKTYQLLIHVLHKTHVTYSHR